MCLLEAGVNIPGPQLWLSVPAEVLRLADADGSDWEQRMRGFAGDPVCQRPKRSQIRDYKLDFRGRRFSDCVAVAPCR